jgi:hypothetical protein
LQVHLSIHHLFFSIIVIKLLFFFFFIVINFKPIALFTKQPTA